MTTTSYSRRRQLSPGLLRRHVLDAPVGPVRAATTAGVGSPVGPESVAVSRSWWTVVAGVPGEQGRGRVTTRRSRSPQPDGCWRGTVVTSSTPGRGCGDGGRRSPRGHRRHQPGRGLPHCRSIVRGPGVAGTHRGAGVGARAAARRTGTAGFTAGPGRRRGRPRGHALVLERGRGGAPGSRDRPDHPGGGVPGGAAHDRTVRPP
jgi:hypothetical protein